MATVEVTEPPGEREDAVGAGLGLRARWVSRVGDDPLGRRVGEAAPVISRQLPTPSVSTGSEKLAPSQAFSLGSTAPLLRHRA